MTDDASLHPDVHRLHAPVAVVVTGGDGVIRYHTPYVARMLAPPLEYDLVGRSFASLFESHARQTVDALLWTLSDADTELGTFVEATCVVTRDYPQSIRITAVRLSENPPLAILVVSQFSLDRLILSAFAGSRLDPLTGVMNRRAFEEHIRSLFSRGLARLPVVVALWDIDDLKLVNDTYGHQFGDRLLNGVGRRLEATLGSFGVVARLGGDDFVAVLPAMGPTEGKRLVETAAQAIRRPIDDLDYQLSASCGAMRSTAFTDLDRLLQQAEVALYATKRSNRGEIRFSGTWVDLDAIP